MATIKSFTDLSQSKILAEILPLESADIYWSFGNIKFMDNDYDSNVVQYIRAWSLAALLGVLPSGYVIVKNYHGFYFAESRGHERSTNIFDNPVDACVDMIIRLHESNLL